MSFRWSPDTPKIHCSNRLIFWISPSRLILRISYIVGFFLVLPILAGCSSSSNTVTVIAINPLRPNFIYIATNSGILKTRNGGETWESITKGLGSTRIISLAIHPTLTATLFAGTMGDSVYRSLDGGQLWGIINAGMKEHVSVVNSLVFHPEDPDIFYAGTTVGVYKSTNGGLMWEELSNKGLDSLYIVPLILDLLNPNSIYVGTSGGVYHSPNGGQTWKLLSKGLFEEVVETGLALGINSLVQDPKSPATFYAGSTRGGFKTNNSGESWELIGGGLGERFIATIVLIKNNPRILYAGTSKGVLKSTDSGETWKDINEGLTNLTIRTLALHPKKDEILYVGTHGGIFKTEDAGGTWIQLDLREKKEKKDPYVP